ncbi:hypothetical protein AOLI_G00012330 [Acnodon oligacanthus]
MLNKADRSTPAQLHSLLAPTVLMFTYSKSERSDWGTCRCCHHSDIRICSVCTGSESDIQYYDSKSDSDYSEDGDDENLMENPYSLPLEFVDDPNFKNKVNYSYTAVQIPTDIYKGCECCSLYHLPLITAPLYKLHRIKAVCC